MKPTNITNFQVTTVRDQANVEQVAIVAQDSAGRLWIRLGIHGTWERLS